MGMRVNNGGWILSYGSSHDRFESLIPYRKCMAERHGDHWFFRLKNSTKAQALSGGSIHSMARVVERSAKALFLVSSGIHHHGNGDSAAHDSRRFGFHCFPRLFSVKTKKKIKQGKLFYLLQHWVRQRKVTCRACQESVCDRGVSLYINFVFVWAECHDAQESTSSLYFGKVPIPVIRLHLVHCVSMIAFTCE